ncbi:MAG: hypothetical protein C4334_15095 [Pyrinomonas sp.]
MSVSEAEPKSRQNWAGRPLRVYETDGVEKSVRGLRFHVRHEHLEDVVGRSQEETVFVHEEEQLQAVDGLRDFAIATNARNAGKIVTSFPESIREHLRAA